MKFNGYERSDGSAGVRNILLVMAVADCSEPVARMIADGVDGAVAVTQHHGCICGEMVANALIGVGENPNVAGVLLVDMGCEGMPARSLGQMIRRTKKPVEWISIQGLGGTNKTVATGKEILERFSQQVMTAKRTEIDVSRLVVGVKCGGSDTTSGLAGNPAVGAFTDMLIDAGGSVIMSEPIEAVGAEEPLAERAINEDVRKEIYRMIGNEEKRWSVPGAQLEFMCKGNIDGGLTTIEEKSMGAIHKSGSRPIMGVLRNDDRKLEKVPKSGGFYLLDDTHLEMMSFSSMAAAGAQIVIFVSGCGATIGHAVLPMIKVTGNPETYRRMSEDMDINAGTIITGEESIDSVGKRILDEVIQVASGKVTAGETFGYSSFSVYRKDPRLEALLNLSQKLP
ncbi:MAG: UxaA family hydrolase [Desulfobacteraceae bacterium]|nr:UxaA family hydrolase [Desulfobacteraceae bacterium]